jgi:hypothetical protein
MAPCRFSTTRNLHDYMSPSEAGGVVDEAAELERRRADDVGAR